MQDDPNSQTLADIDNRAINRAPFGSIQMTTSSAADQVGVITQEEATMVRCARCWDPVGTLVDTKPGSFCEKCAAL